MKCNCRHCFVQNTSWSGDGGDALDCYRANIESWTSGIPASLNVGSCMLYSHTYFLLYPQRLYSMLWHGRDTNSKIFVWEIFQKVGDEFLIPKLWCRWEDAVPVSLFLLHWEVSGFRRGFRLWIQSRERCSPLMLTNLGNRHKQSTFLYLYLPIS